MTHIQAAYKKVKNTGWNNATVSLFIIHRRLDPNSRVATYSALSVNADTPLRKRLRTIANNVISNSNKVTAYEYNTVDHDDDLLGLTVEETDMKGIINQIMSNKIQEATCTDHLLNAWLYIARLDLKNEAPLFAMRQISRGWTTTKISGLTNLIFRNNMLIDIDSGEVFKIDNKIDFFSQDDVIFIADKKNFESAMNFRVGMEKNRDAIVHEFVANKVLNSGNTLATLVGDNMRRLRKLAEVKKSGYYKDPSFMARLKAVNTVESWGLVYLSDGTLDITEDNIDAVLRMLNNDRLRSPINNENFDVDVKHKL
jgi:hypothetical protein